MGGDAFGSVDLEGTGSASGEVAAIVQIALVPLGPVLEPMTGDAFATYVNPGRPITPQPWLPHQITDATVRGGGVVAGAGSTHERLLLRASESQAPQRNQGWSIR